MAQHFMQQELTEEPFALDTKADTAWRSEEDGEFLDPSPEVVTNAEETENQDEDLEWALNLNLPHLEPEAEQEPEQEETMVMPLRPVTVSTSSPSLTDEDEDEDEDTEKELTALPDEVLIDLTGNIYEGRANIYKEIKSLPRFLNGDGSGDGDGDCCEVIPAYCYEKSKSWIKRLIRTGLRCKSEKVTENFSADGGDCYKNDHTTDIDDYSCNYYIDDPFNATIFKYSLKAVQKDGGNGNNILKELEYIKTHKDPNYCCKFIEYWVCEDHFYVALNGWMQPLDYFVDNTLNNMNCYYKSRSQLLYQLSESILDNLYNMRRFKTAHLNLRPSNVMVDIKSTINGDFRSVFVGFYNCLDFCPKNEELRDVDPHKCTVKTPTTSATAITKFVSPEYQAFLNGEADCFDAYAVDVYSVGALLLDVALKTLFKVPSYDGKIRFLVPYLKENGYFDKIDSSCWDLIEQMLSDDLNERPAVNDIVSKDRWYSICNNVVGKLKTKMYRIKAKQHELKMKKQEEEEAAAEILRIQQEEADRLRLKQQQEQEQLLLVLQQQQQQVYDEYCRAYYSAYYATINTYNPNNVYPQSGVAIQHQTQPQMQPQPQPQYYAPAAQTAYQPIYL